MKGGIKINSSEEVGKALKKISERIKQMKDEPIIECPKTGCRYCENHIREEGYDQQWGAFYFMYHSCKLGLNDTYKSGGTCDCPDFKEGKETLIYMSEKEKSKCPH